MLVSAAPLEAGKGKRGKELAREDLTNFFLGPHLSQWLVGPMSKIASEEERRRYLALTDDAKAEAFIAEFWQARVDPSRPWPQEQPQGVFERRAATADRIYTEGTHLGRRTDRGETLILYGFPDNVRYWAGGDRRRRQEITIEIWDYSKNAPAGLNMQTPERQYYFVKKDELTVRYYPEARQLRSIQPQGGPR